MSVRFFATSIAPGIPPHESQARVLKSGDFVSPSVAVGKTPARLLPLPYLKNLRTKYSQRFDSLPVSTIQAYLRVRVQSIIFSWVKVSPVQAAEEVALKFCVFNRVALQPST